MDFIFTGSIPGLDITVGEVEPALRAHLACPGGVGRVCLFCHRGSRRQGYRGTFKGGASRLSTQGLFISFQWWLRVTNGATSGLQPNLALPVYILESRKNTGFNPPALQLLLSNDFGRVYRVALIPGIEWSSEGEFTRMKRYGILGVGASRAGESLAGKTWV